VTACVPQTSSATRYVSKCSLIDQPHPVYLGFLRLAWYVHYDLLAIRTHVVSQILYYTFICPSEHIVT
jgi:hypothetical protein